MSVSALLLLYPDHVGSRKVCANTAEASALASTLVDQRQWTMLHKSSKVLNGIMQSENLLRAVVSLQQNCCAL